MGVNEGEVNKRSRIREDSDQCGDEDDDEGGCEDGG